MFIIATVTHGKDHVITLPPTIKSFLVGRNGFLHIGINNQYQVASGIFREPAVMAASFPKLRDNPSTVKLIGCASSIAIDKVSSELPSSITIISTWFRNISLVLVGVSVRIAQSIPLIENGHH